MTWMSLFLDVSVFKQAAVLFGSAEVIAVIE
jgi:hypothetical protein